MKKLLVRSVSLTLLLAAFPAGLATAGPVSYAPGDLFLGVRATAEPGSVQAYLVNIGAASAYRDAAGSFVVPGLGDLAADLSFLFGPDWHSRSDVLWSVSGTPGPAAAGGDPARTLYATSPQAAPGEADFPLVRRNFSAHAGPTNKMTALAVSYLQEAGVPRQSTQHSPVAITQTSTDSNGYHSFQTGGSSYGYFTPAIEGVFVHESLEAALNLYRLAPAPESLADRSGERIGSFTLQADGSLIFTKPSPSSIPVAVGLAFSGTVAEVRFTGTPARSYRIERSANLSTGSWTELATATADAQGVIVYLDESPPVVTAYYRAGLP